jgi:exo-beta-1,3-glucanase (GH17 family)/cellulose synthase/poly-beta-1,6-N-acetylglucosamine synthase-like glycosyltransferase
LSAHIRRIGFSGILIAAIIILANVGYWSWSNRPQHEEAYLGEIKGFSFSPFHRGEDPAQDKYPTPSEINSDLALVSHEVRSVRTYDVLHGLDEIAPLARHHNLKVTAGAWIDGNPKDDTAEVDALIRLARANRNIDHVIVGNEALLRGDIAVDQLVQYIRKVRRMQRAPVSTAEPWHVWLKHPELVHEVDFMAVHVLPYWEGVPLDHAVDYILQRYHELQKAYPGKKIILTEVGWPSAGKTRGGAETGIVNEGRFLRQFLNAARVNKIDYFIMEAFDQPYKQTFEGTVGAYWGVYDADRKPKFPMSGTLREYRRWPTLATVTSVLGLIGMLLYLSSHDNVSVRGRLFYASLIQFVVTGSVWMGRELFDAYLGPTQIAVLIALLLAQLILIVTLLSEGFQIVELLFARRFKRRFLPFAAEPTAADGSMPKVSIHVPACNEPPHMVIQTLESLAAQDYPNFEVLVIDNNTKDEALWRPVEAWCAAAGPKFKFFHLPNWPGFKSGALNFALRETDPAAEIVGVLDSDYVVRPDWLRSLVPYFRRPEVNFVQAPQDHREWAGSAFKEMINWEYAGFFHIGMVHRNERNAIIQHGTMTLIRRSALQDQLGGWAEWCICEDAELGLRLLQLGGESVYVQEVFGRGLTPDSFAGYKRQRFRWVYGAVQIVRRHWRALLTPKSQGGLTFAQRYHFVTGWLPWIADLMHVVFTVGALAWTIGLVAWPKRFDFPLTLFLAPALGVLGFKFFGALWLYRARVPCSALQRIGAALAAMALSFTVARAIVAGIVSPQKPFFRTPKCENRPALLQGFLMAWEETLIAALLFAAAVAIFAAYGVMNLEARLWGLMMMAQSVPYVSALITSLIAALPPATIARVRLALPFAARTGSAPQT